MKANQAVVVPDEFSILDMWVNKVMYQMRDYRDDSKEIQLQRVELSIIGVGTPKSVRDKVHNLVCQQLKL